MYSRRESMESRQLRSSQSRDDRYRSSEPFKETKTVAVPLPALVKSEISSLLTSVKSEFERLQKQLLLISTAGSAAVIQNTNDTIATLSNANNETILNEFRVILKSLEAHVTELKANQSICCTNDLLSLIKEQERLRTKLKHKNDLIDELTQTVDRLTPKKQQVDLLTV